MGPRLITDPEGLEELARGVATRKRAALDTEAASFHRYVDRVYLIQVSTDHETALVDPLKLADLAPLGRLLSDATIEIVFHDADYDLRILDRDYGFRARNLFDTRVAAQLAGEPAVGLGALLEKYFKVRLNKKLQRADWSRRPLTPEMIAYAADDTRYLPSLRDVLEQRLTQLGRLAWAQEEFRRVEAIRWTGSTVEEEDAYLRIRGAGSVRDPRARAVLRELYRWREATARELDRAPFRVLENSALLNLARAAPTTAGQFQEISGVPPSAIRRHGSAIQDAVRRGLAVPDAELPRIRRAPRAPADPAYDQRLEGLKRLRNRRAEVLELDPGLVCPNGTLQALARAAPRNEQELGDVRELRRWQREVLGDDEILATVGE